MFLVSLKILPILSLPASSYEQSAKSRHCPLALTIHGFFANHLVQHVEKRPYLTPGGGHHIQRGHDAGFLLSFLHLPHISQIVAHGFRNGSLRHRVMQPHLQ